MHKITVIVLTKAQEAIADILALDSQELPSALSLPQVAKLSHVPTPPPEVKLTSLPAPEAESPPVPVPPLSQEVLDSEGLPWDKRIHSGGKTFLAKDDTWKLARGVNSLLVAQVKTELRQAQGVPLSVGPPALRPATAHTPEGSLTWAQLMEKIAEAGTGPGEVTTACQKFNVANIGVLQDTPVLVPLVAKELGF